MVPAISRPRRLSRRREPRHHRRSLSPLDHHDPAPRRVDDIPNEALHRLSWSHRPVRYLQTCRSVFSDTLQFPLAQARKCRGAQLEATIGAEPCKILRHQPLPLLGDSPVELGPKIANGRC
jgi:hypothetical protein